METIQNVTNTDTGTTSEYEVQHEKLLKMNQQKWIDFNAIGGLITEEDGTLKPMTITAFANLLGVTRKTLYDWKHSVPNFNELVQKRRKQLGSQNRIVKVWNGLYLKAAAGNPQAAAIWLANHDPDFRMPAQKVEHEAGNSWAALLANKRKVIDVEVTDATTND